MTTSDTWEVFAIKYAGSRGRRRAENFIVADRHDEDGPLFYYVWVVRNAERTIVVDTGFDPDQAQKRGRELEVRPRDGLAALDVDAAKVRDVIITHLHWDHAGTLGDFPEATFHVQDSEMRFATGRCMCHRFFRRAFEVEHVVDLVRRVHDGRVCFHDGVDTIAPGVTVHHVGGHTMGMQCVRVSTRRGAVVLASDALHLYENMETAQPYPTVYNVNDMIEGWSVLRRLAESDAHIVAGHDPRVMAEYPAASEALAGRAVRLDVEPRS